MAVKWRLFQILEERGIKNPSQLQAVLQHELGICISRVALAKLLKNPPSALRLETGQIFCSLLGVSLEAFLTVTPEPIIKHPTELIQPYGKSKQPVESLIVDPGKFF